VSIVNIKSPKFSILVLYKCLYISLLPYISIPWEKFLLEKLIFEIFFSQPPFFMVEMRIY